METAPQLYIYFFIYFIVFFRFTLKKFKKKKLQQYKVNKIV